MFDEERNEEERNLSEERKPEEIIEEKTEKEPETRREEPYNSYSSYEGSKTEQTQEPLQVYGSGSGHKGNGFGRKLAGVAVAAATFGLVAGGMMLGTEYLGRLYGTGNISEQTADNTGNSSSNSNSRATLTKNTGSEDKDSEEMTLSNSEKVDKEDKENTSTSKELASTQSVSVSILDVSPVVEEVMPSVVAVTNMTVYTSSGYTWNWYGDGSSNSTKVPSAGSGVIIAEDDDEILILTNAHVVVPEEYSHYTIDSFEMSVTFADDTNVTAHIKGSDSEADLAVIAVNKKDVSDDTMSKIRIATIGSSDDMKVGNGVIAIGNAMGFGQSVTVGYISALNRQVTVNKVTRTLLQTDAAINPGNSGGGLFNTKGELIGINSAKYSSEEVEGIGYAIPITSVENIVEELMNTEPRQEVTDENEKSFIGVSADQKYSSFYGQQGLGAFVSAVVEGGPAEKAGIMAYDIITGIDDTKITSWDDMTNALKYYKGGDTVTITYQSFDANTRTYSEKQVELTLAYRKDFTNKT